MCPPLTFRFLHGSNPAASPSILSLCFPLLALAAGCGDAATSSGTQTTGTDTTTGSGGAGGSGTTTGNGGSGGSGGDTSNGGSGGTSSTSGNGGSGGSGGGTGNGGSGGASSSSGNGGSGGSTGSSGGSGGSGGSTGSSGGSGGSGGGCAPADETCNGIDDDCNGAIDDVDPAGAMMCNTGLLGACGQGITVCAAGSVQCSQQVFPSAEVGDGIDNDCNGLVDELPTGAGLWAQGYGDPDFQSAFELACDAGGNVIAVGRASGAIDFGGGALPQNGQPAPFLVKLAPDGTHLLSKAILATDSTTATGLSIDPAGYIYLGGRITGDADFGGTVLASSGGSSDAFVAKYTPDGNLVWARSFGDGSYQEGRAVAATATGGVVLTGYGSGVMDFGGGPLLGSGSNIYLAAFKEDGSPAWSKRFSQPGVAYGEDVAVDGAGNVVLLATPGSATDLGGGLMTSPTFTSYNPAIAKYSAEGTHLWSKLFSGPQPAEAGSVAVDASGNIVLTGALKGPVDFGGGAVSAPSNNGIFVVKLDPGGNHLWSRAYGITNGLAMGKPDVAVDGLGNVLLAGAFSYNVSFGGPLLVGSQSSYSNAYVVKLDAGGNHVWTHQYGDPGNEYEGAGAVATDPSGNVLVTGAFGSTIDFGTGPLVSNDTTGQDVFIAKLAP